MHPNLKLGPVPQLDDDDDNHFHNHPNDFHEHEHEHLNEHLHQHLRGRRCPEVLSVRRDCEQLISRRNRH